LFGTIDFLVEKKYYGSQWSLVPIVLQNTFVCVQQKKETHTGLQQLEDEEMMTEFSFLDEVSL